MYASLMQGMNHLQVLVLLHLLQELLLQLLVLLHLQELLVLLLHLQDHSLPEDKLELVLLITL